MRTYLDYNATAPLRPEARAATSAVLDVQANAQSVHAEGRRARAAIETARGEVAKLAGCESAEVTFTSGGTEANALALRGALEAAAAGGTRITRLIVSAVEHESVRATAAACADALAGLRVVTCPVTPGGAIDLDEFARLLNEGKGRALISLMAANNETGVIQPVREAAALAHQAGALVHCDAVQVPGKMALDFAALGVDLMSLSAHKIGGPQGVGALIARESMALAAQLRGGAQESGRRAGTENVAAIAGFGAAAEAARRDLGYAPAWGAWRLALEGVLRAASREAVVFGEGEERLPTTISIAAPAVPAENMVIALDLDGFAVSAGAACSSGKVTQSHVLTAMGVRPELASAAIRISFGWKTQEHELAAFADAWTRIVTRAEARAAA
jgi:cysteine desulfurase